MRWNASNVAFSRPIRWLLALQGAQAIPFEYAGTISVAETRGLRFSDPESQVVKNPADYFAYLEKQGILLDVEARKAEIKKQIDQLAKAVKGEIRPDTDLLAEVTHLVEAPTALRGTFEKSFLSLPTEVLVEVMKKHQRYFPVQKDGRLLPHFVTVRNGDDQHLDIIARGNENVIRARFADAAFFVEDDLKRPLEDFLPQLDTLTFQTDLGSMLDKTKRIVKLVEDIASQLALNADEKKTALRAAELSKADLATSMVVEITSLQGVMGQQYALKSGEPEEVAQAIYEHYLPRSSRDRVPESKAGLAVSLADKLDSLAGLFAAGLAPTGAKDPFAQRRSALGIVQALIATDTNFDLRAGLESAAKELPIGAASERLTECLEFIIERMRNLFLEEGWRYDVVDSVLGGQGHNPAGAKRAVAQLTKWVERKDWHEILPEYSRCVRITRDQSERFKVNPKLFSEDAEKELFKALEKAEASERKPGCVDNFLNAFVPMIPAVKKFFDDVLVMTEDEKVRQNRLGLLHRIVALADGMADMSRLEGF
jgi:glycyl-tRNA synthetase